MGPDDTGASAAGPRQSGAPPAPVIATAPLDEASKARPASVSDSSTVASSRGEPGRLPDLSGKLVYVIDSNSLIFQVFHAIPEMTSPRGEPVNAVFGFTRDLLYLLENKRPDYLFCSFDMSGPTFRH